METNKLYEGDNLQIINKIPSGSIDLIYLDPPYNTGRDFEQFNDKWNSNNEYIEYIYDRIKELHRLLKPTGSIYLHCDYRMSHYLRFALDEIFGENNFKNEIIWVYQKCSNSNAKKFMRSHDNILYYTKTNKYTFNRVLQIASRKHRDPKRGYNTKTQFGKKYLYIYNDNKVKIDKNKFDFIKYVYPEKGVPYNDVFHISTVNSCAKERTGYPTQKPIQLLNVIIQSSSNPGDIVLDPFCGSGTTCVASHNLNRKYIGIDINPKAIKIAKKRLSQCNLNLFGVG